MDALEMAYEISKQKTKEKQSQWGISGVTAYSSALGCKVSTYIWAKLCNVDCRPHLSV